MNKQEKDEWIAALRSGDFVQGYGRLNDHNKYCCLGVKCELDVRAGRHGIKDIIDIAGIVLYGIEDDAIQGFTPSMPTITICDRWGISRDTVHELATMNDGNLGRGIKRHTFSEIADWIERNIPTKD
jgi:hypothetical protein